MERSGGHIYSSSNDLEAAYRRLEKDKAVEESNKQLILKFANAWLAKGFTKARAVKLVFCLRKLASILEKPFSEANKDDMMALVGKLEATDLAASTKYDLKVILKTFYKWYKGDDEQLPKEVSWIKPKLKNGSHKLPEEMLSEEDVIKMAQAATNLRDKAIVLVLYETGCRIGELLSLKLKNVQFDQYGAILRVTGKTGDRRVRIISSAPALSAWVENYGQNAEPDAALWPPRSTNKGYNDYSAVHRSVYKTLKTLAKEAGIRKRIHPHLFRHSRATALASKLTEAQMKEYFGWTQSSDMASIYVHLSGRDVDNALLALQGFAKAEDRQEEQLKVIFCQRCREKNAPSAKFCLRCGTPTDAKIALQVEDEKKASNDLLNKLMENQEFKEFLYKKAIELGIN